MDPRTRYVLFGLVGVAGAVVFLGMHVYPFRYGLLESVAVAAVFVVVAVVSHVLDDTSF